MKNFPWLLLLVVVFCSCSGQVNTVPSHGPENKDSIAALLLSIDAKQKAFQLDTLFKNMHKQKGFNGNVLVVQRGQVIYKNCFGFSNYEKKDSLKLNSAFQLASLSKPFTAIAIMILKEKGKLDYADEVTKYFPGFPYRGITIKQLLCHRSGLPNYNYFCADYTADHDSPICNSDVIGWMEEHKPEPYDKPDKHFHYCNTNYCILESIVEKVSGETFAAFMKKNVFIPLKMNDTWVKNSVDDTLRKNKTRGYNAKWKREKDDYLDGVLGDKGIYSTVEDLYKWDRALYTDSLLKQTTLMEAFAPTSFEKPGVRNYGYGWRLIIQPDSSKVVYHNGWWHGYNTGCYRRLSDQTAVIILGNKYNKSIYHIKGVLQVLGGKGNTEAGEGEE